MQALYNFKEIKIMNKCPLCDAELKEKCSDIGPKIHIQCPNCGNYEASSEAIGHIQNSSFGSRKDKFKITIQNLNKRKESAEITVVEKDDTRTISARKISHE
jgi:predicted ATP-dependent serine protease